MTAKKAPTTPNILDFDHLLRQNPQDVPLGDSVTAYAVLDHFEKAFEARKKLLRPHILAQAETHGDPNDKGGSALVVGEEQVVRERRRSSEPNSDKLRALLETRGVPLLECFDEVRSVQLNPSRLQYLIDIGKLKQDEVDALRDETFALRVRPGPTLRYLLSSVSGESGEGEGKKAEKAARVKR
jgi:hypothetical protein